MSLKFLKGTKGSDQLYHDYHLYYKIRNKWCCINKDCGATIATIGEGAEMRIDTSKPSKSPHIDGIITYNDYLCRITLQNIKDRMAKELKLKPKMIFEEEIKKLQNEHSVSIETIGQYIRPYTHYQPSYEKIRAKKRPVLPKTNALLALLRLLDAARPQTTI
jgi:hypothetical protein